MPLLLILLLFKQNVPFCRLHLSFLLRIISLQLAIQFAKETRLCFWSFTNINRVRFAQPKGNVTASAINLTILLLWAVAAQRRTRSRKRQRRWRQFEPLGHLVLDGGASTTVTGLDILHAVGGDVDNLLDYGEDSLLAANGLPLKTIGRLDLTIRYITATVETPIVISPEADGMLMSWFVCIDLLAIIQPRFKICYWESRKARRSLRKHQKQRNRQSQSTRHRYLDWSKTSFKSLLTSLTLPDYF